MWLNLSLQTSNNAVMKRMEKDSNIVISSRVRLARNFDSVPYPSVMNDDEANGIVEKVYKAVKNSGDYGLYNMSRLDNVAASALKEKHLISADLLANKTSGAVIINQSETVSIMINEEDHLREQCILSGENLMNCYNIINRVDDEIDDKISFSFDPRLGFLTACPTNVGTGLRASAMMFLPALTIMNQLDECIKAISRYNMTIRGLYGEGSKSLGYVYQASNQRTLGLCERDIIDSVIRNVECIKDAELRCRQELLATQGAELKDKIMRAYGILTNCYKLTSDEFMSLIALVKLGVFYDMIPINDYAKLENLITKMQPANLILAAKQDLSPQKREIYRASYVSHVLKKICV